MKLGFLTAALPNSTLEQAAHWGAENGFQAIDIACWPREKATLGYYSVLLQKHNIEEHKHYWTKGEIHQLAEQNGFTVKKYKTFQLGLNQMAVLQHA